ncbi:MAG: M24 family metallopeptidase [Acidimicrobiia bacterium]
MTSLLFDGQLDHDLDLGRMRRERHARLVDAMRETGLDAVLLLGQSNVGYATGARVVAADQARAIHRRPVALVTADGDPAHLWTWYPEGAPPDLPERNVHAGVSLESETGARALLDEVATWAPPRVRLAVDELTMPVRAVLADRGRPVGDAQPALSRAKVQKTPDELECIRRAQAINEAAIAALMPSVVPGTRGTALTGELLRRVVELGATWNNVDPIWQAMPRSVADGPFSATGGVVFPTVTTPRPLGRGDVVWVDNGLAYEGYMSDYGHTWIVGDEPNARQRDQARRWRDIVAAALDAIRPGATARDLTRAATDEADLAGSARPWLPHLYLAHGSGVDSAEAPLVGTDLGDEFDESVALVPGTVMVLEPVVWDDANAGFRAEQVVTVTDDGWESLSNLTWDGWE